jgi:AsmA family protein
MRLNLKMILMVAAGVILVIIVGVVLVLRSLDINKYRGLIAEQAKDATGRELKIGGKISLEIGFSPAVVVEDVSLANAPWGYRQEMLKVRRFEVEVALIPLIFRDIRIKRLILVQPDILLETDAKGIGNWSLGGATPSAPPATKPADTRGGLAALAVEKVRIEKGNLTYRDGKTKRATALFLDRLDLRAKDAASPLTIDLAAAYDGKAFTLTGTVGPLGELMAPPRPYPVTLTFKAGGATLEAAGTIAKPMEAAGLDIKVSAKGQEVAEVARLADKSVPALGPFTVKGQVTGSLQALSVGGIDASFGKSKLAGNVVVGLGGPRPKLKAQLTSALLDLAELLPKEKTTPTRGASQQKTPGPGQDNRMFPADPLPLSSLRSADAELDLKLDTLVLPNKLALEGLAMHLALAGGRLDVQPLSSRIGGGTMTGSLSLDASAGKTALLTAKADAKAIDLGQVLRQMGNPDLVTRTKTDISLNLRGSGASVRELMAGLNGDMLLVLGEGKINSKFVEWLGADLLTQIVDTLNPFGKPDPYTQLKCGVIRFAARDGVASTDRGIAFETGKMTVVSSGTVNLKTEAIDFSMRPEMRQALGIGAGELVKLLRIRGTLAEPKIGLDQLEAAKSVVSIGAAVATAGISFLAESLTKGATAGSRPCETAMAKAPAPTKGGSASPAAVSTGQEAPKQGGGVQQLLRGLFGK